MKMFSGLGNVVVLFMGNEHIILHKVIFNELPDIYSLNEVFNELPEYISDSIEIGALFVDIITMNDYIIEYGDFEIDENNVVEHKVR